MPYATPRSKSAVGSPPRIDMRGKADDDNIETMIGRSVEVDQRSGCWLWTKSKNTKGYAQSSRINTGVHRFIYETLVGVIPEGHHLHHECKVRHCVNPAHLTPLTPTEHRRVHA